MRGSFELLFEVRSQSSGRWISTSPADWADTFMSTAPGVIKRKVCSFVKHTIASLWKTSDEPVYCSGREADISQVLLYVRLRALRGQ